MKWNDVSSYSRSEAKREPKSVEASAGGLKMVVTRHIHYPGKWVVSCAPFFDTRELSSVELDAAKVEATNLVRAKLEAAVKALD